MIPGLAQIRAVAVFATRANFATIAALITAPFSEAPLFIDSTTGGLLVKPEALPAATPFNRISDASNNALVVQATPGRVTGGYAINTNAAVRYLKLYNKATAPDPATDTPVMVIPLPPSVAVPLKFGAGLGFATGIGMLLVTGVANTNNTAVAANEISVGLAIEAY
jgi:hypothetical protein